MKIFLKRKNGLVDAVAEYDIKTGDCKVLAGSILSENIAESKTFRGTASIKKARAGKLSGSRLMVDTSFRSASTAANFVTGTSTNGLVTWKNEDGKSIKEILKEEKNE